MRALRGPDSPLQKGGKHWGPPRKSWLWNSGISLVRAEHYPPAGGTPEGILERGWLASG